MKTSTKISIAWTLNLIWLMCLLFPMTYLVGHGQEWMKESVEHCLIAAWCAKFGLTCFFLIVFSQEQEIKIS